jgi:hypothetical protein
LDDFPQLTKDVHNEDLFGDKFDTIIHGLFLAPNGSDTKLHKDTAENLIAMIEGTKLIALVPPQRDSTILNEKVLLPLLKPTRETLQEHPMFTKESRPIIFELKKGEMLYLPIGYLHYVFNVTDSISVTCWGKNLNTPV